MLEKVKLALRVSTGAFDSEIEDLIAAALADLGIDQREESDPLILRAVITYCRVYFGEPSDFDKMRAAYDEQKAQLQTATGYTNWGEADG